MTLECDDKNKLTDSLAGAVASEILVNGVNSKVAKDMVNETVAILGLDREEVLIQITFKVGEYIRQAVTPIDSQS